jgi:hypothetical protein
MSHPPIPEQCNLFAKFNGHWVFMSSVVGCQVDESKGTQRTIVASVAECAWRREAERYDELLYAMERVGTGSDGCRAEIKAQYDAAMEAAEQWREWGEIK